MDKKKSKFKKGFSIAEVMLATFILTIGMVSLLKLVSGSTAASIDSRKSVIAAQLAEEGIEIVRNLRDTNIVSGKTAFDLPKFTINSDCGNPIVADNSGVLVDYLTSVLAGCSLGDKTLNINNGAYVKPGSGSASAFKRKLIMDFDSSTPPTKVTVTSMVIWKSTFETVGNCLVANKCVFSQETLTAY